MAHMLEHNPGRVPNWDAQRIMQVRRLQMQLACGMQEVPYASLVAADLLRRRRNMSGALPCSAAPLVAGGLLCLQMDHFCLRNGKRCVMWDDEGVGFYLVS